MLQQIFEALHSVTSFVQPVSQWQSSSANENEWPVHPLSFSVADERRVAQNIA